jgi:nucleoside-diphosphate-sugar epimerase
VFHRGQHEVAGLDEAEHLHGDPFSDSSLQELLNGRTFDLALVMYGRTRLIARMLAGRCDRLITISGVPVYAGYLTGTGPFPATPVRESDPILKGDGAGLPYPAHLVRDTEDLVLRMAGEGAFSVTVLRYSTLYGPRVPHPWEWSIVRRILDGRRFIVLPDGGLSIHSRLATKNASHCVLLAAEAGDIANGKVYNVADDYQYTLADWIRAACRSLDAELEIISIPGDVASPGWGLYPFGYPGVSPHLILDTHLSKADLGYRDQVRPLDALRSTVEWCYDNPDAVHPDDLIDPFDYPREDALVAAYHDALVGLADLALPFSHLKPLRAPQSGRHAGVEAHDAGSGTC